MYLKQFPRAHGRGERWSKEDRSVEPSRYDRSKHDRELARPKRERCAHPVNVAEQILTIQRQGVSMLLEGHSSTLACVDRLRLSALRELHELPVPASEVVAKAVAGACPSDGCTVGAPTRHPTTAATPEEAQRIAGDRILAMARWEEGQGPPGVRQVYNLLTMHNGGIVKMEDFFDSAAAERAFAAPD